jgi:penicillin V acylase-like amidase (Ntn superfamily)
MRTTLAIDDDVLEEARRRLVTLHRAIVDLAGDVATVEVVAGRVEPS